ncbi:MAG: hypothetical protein GY754_18215 [bacterium]|nr:hypothetical protein [bacterium]
MKIRERNIPFIKICLFFISIIVSTVSCENVLNDGLKENNQKEITSFVFEAANNEDLSSDITATINDTSITVVVPENTDITNLVASYRITGETVLVNGIEQFSGESVNDFSEVKIYRIEAKNLTVQEFTIIVIIESNPDTTPPLIEKASVASSVGDSSGTYQFSVMVADDREVSLVTANLNEDSYAPTIDENIYTFSIPVTELAYGNNAITVEAMDSSENSSSLPVTVSLDDEIDPVFAISNASPGTIISWPWDPVYYNVDFSVTDNKDESCSVSGASHIGGNSHRITVNAKDYGLLAEKSTMHTVTARDQTGNTSTRTCKITVFTICSETTKNLYLCSTNIRHEWQ